MKFKLRRAISMALLLSIGLSGIPIVPYTAYGNAPYHGDSGGESSGGTGVSNGTWNLISPRQQGVRFSTVHPDGESVVTNGDRNSRYKITKNGVWFDYYAYADPEQNIVVKSKIGHSTYLVHNRWKTK